MGSLPDEQRLKVDTVAIIGAGPSGLAAAKYLLAERSFSKIVIFEQRSNVCGLWNYASALPDELATFPIPQESPHGDLEEPQWRLNGNDAQPFFPSPVYDRLETNIPRGLMGFSNLDWPSECQLFPKHEEVLEYIERYGKDVRHLIHFNTRVLDVRPGDDGTWHLETRHLTPKDTNPVQHHVFDAVLVANGHFNVPFIPAVPGVEAWRKSYLGSIIHSKFYRNPEEYRNKRVVVVGNSASGVDISAQIATTCKLPLLQSQKSESYFQPGTSTAILEKPEITRFIPEDRTICFRDGSIETGVDSIVYCTGYFYSYPFLKALSPAPVTTGECVENTYQHIFYRPRPTLAFAVLNQKVIPFPLAEAQSAVIARVWSGRLELPTDSEMKDWEEKTLKQTGGGRNFHVLKFPEDANYINALHEWAKCADGQGQLEKKPHPSEEIPNGALEVGKMPPFWGEREYWTRERFPAMKKAFQRFGEERHSKRTLEDIGFDFEAWKQARDEDQS